LKGYEQGEENEHRFHNDLKLLISKLKQERCHL